jgi:asparagine synthetase B (glutamine-hydrolysing)
MVQAGLCRVNQTLPHEDAPLLQSLDDIPDFMLQTVDDLIFHLDRSVMLRVQSIPPLPPIEGGGRTRIAVLFSGGIDSTILAFLANRCVVLPFLLDSRSNEFTIICQIDMFVQANV